MSTTAVSYGDIILTLIAPRVIVEAAPERALMSLALVVGADRERLFCSEDRLYLGNDRHGNEVVYRVTGWDADRMALIVERQSGPLLAEEPGPSGCRRMLITGGGLSRCSAHEDRTHRCIMTAHEIGTYHQCLCTERFTTAADQASWRTSTPAP